MSLAVELARRLVRLRARASRALEDVDLRYRRRRVRRDRRPERRRQDDARPARRSGSSARRRATAALFGEPAAPLLAAAHARLPRAARAARRRRAGDGARGGLGRPARRWRPHRAASPARSRARRRGDRARRARRAVADAPLRTLSGGQQQRAFIAKALAGEPSLLVLDEPTTGVDVESQEALAALLERCTRELGVTILYVSHEFGAVEHFVERLVLVSARRSSSTARPPTLPGRLARPVARPCSSSSSCGSRSRAGAVVGVLAPAVGFFLVQRRQSASSATASATSRSRASPPGSSSTSRRSSRRSSQPSSAASRSSGCGRDGGTAGDQALALVFYTGIAAGVVLVSARGRAQRRPVRSTCSARS